MPKRAGAGRKTDYTEKLADEICELVASQPAGLETICRKNPHLPGSTTIYRWLVKHEEFAEKYLKAKRLQVNILVDQMLDIADDSSGDVIVGEDGQERLNREFYQRSRLKIDTRKFLAAKLLPRLYGDKVITEITGKDGGAIVKISTNTADPIEASRIYQETISAK